MDQNDLQSMREVTFDDPSGQIDPSLEEPSPLGRFALAITSPREAFQNILNTETLGRIIGWGMLIGIIVALFGVILISSNPAFMEKQRAEQQAKLDKRHDEGKMSDEQYEAATQGMEKMQSKSGMIMGFAVGGAILATPMIYLFMGLILYVISRVLQTEQDTRLQYSTALATMLIASIVASIGTIVQFIGTALTQNPKFALDLTLIAQPNNQIVASLLGLTNPFTLWAVAVTGLGIATIARTSWRKGTIAWGVAMAIILIIVGIFKQIYA